MLTTHNFAFLSLSLSHSPSNFPVHIHRLQYCLIALHAWCCRNSDKSECVLFGTRQRSYAFPDVTSVNVAGPVVPLTDDIKLLGVSLDNRLLVDEHVNEASRAWFYHLRSTSITAKTPTWSPCYVVGSRLDYTNAYNCTSYLRRT